MDSLPFPLRRKISYASLAVKTEGSRCSFAGSIHVLNERQLTFSHKKLHQHTWPESSLLGRKARLANDGYTIKILKTTFDQSQTKSSFALNV